MQRTMRTAEELEKMAKHKGRAYECLHCSRQDKSLIDVKSRVEDHILKYHLGLDQAPFYCTLCLFRSTERKPLLEHVFRHSRHKQEAQNKNIVDSTPYLKESQTPYKMGSADLRQLSQDESVRVFLQKMQQNQEDRNQRDRLGKAFDEVFPHGIEDLDSVQESPIPPILQTQTPPPAPLSVPGLQTAQPATQTSNMLTSLLISGLQHTIQQSFGAGGLINPLQTSDMIPTGPPSLCGSTASTTHKPPAIASRPASLCGSATDLALRPSEESLKPVSSTVTNNTTEVRSSHSTALPATCDFEDLPSTGENILPQLLGVDEPSEPSVKSPVAPEPQQKVTETSAATDGPPTAPKSDPLAQYFERLHTQLEQHNKNIVEELNKNTRSIRCLEKAVREQVEIMNSLLRINAREERRREERREEERREERKREEREEERREDRRTQREADGKRKADSQPERHGKRRKEEKENSSPKIKSVLGQLYPEKPKRK